MHEFLVQPKVEQVVNEDLSALRLSMKNTLAATARLQKANADAIIYIFW